MKKNLCFIISILLAGSMAILNGQSKPSEYKVANRFHIEGDGGWDYLVSDESTGRIFVSHGMVVQVIDEKDGKLLGTIPDTKGVHGIAIAQDLNKAYISNGQDSSVIIINLTSLAFISKVSVTGQNPDAILYDKFSRRVFVFNGRTANATVIDAGSDKVVATIRLSGKPEFSVTDGKGRVYVNIEDKSEIAVINPITLKVEKTWQLAPGEEPSGLALDNGNHRLFSVCGNNLMVVVDAVSGKVISTLPIGKRTDGVAFDSEMKRAYSSNGEGTMTVVSEVNPNVYKVLENFPTQPGARTITINSKTHHLYLPTADIKAATSHAGSSHNRPSAEPGTFTLLDLVPLK